MMRLAIICTHPIQYYSPWFRFLATRGLSIKVFYLWDFGVTERLDRGFGHSLTWDVPLLEGYDYEFVPNSARDPGTHHFWGLQNPLLRERVAEYSPGAVLTLGYNFASLVALLLSPGLWHVPFILCGDSHKLGRRATFREEIKDSVRNVVFRRYSAFLHVGLANRDYYRAAGVPESRLFFFPHAVDNDRFSAARQEAERERTRWRAQLGIGTDAVVFLFVGKLEVKKRPDLLLEAFGSLPSENAHLLFVGAGELEALLKARVEADRRVRFLPFQNQSRMPAVYALGDILVLPSQGSGETWGLCVNEAMCMERAVIVSDHVGCGPDLVRLGENGWVFSAGDVTALTAVLKEACADRDRLRRYGMRSLEVVKNYSYHEATSGLMSALDYCLKPRAGSPH